MNKLIYILLLVIAIPVHAKVYIDEDKFTGTKFEDVGAWGAKYSNVLKGRAFEGGLSITPGRITTKEKQTYLLRTRWTGKSWIFIGRRAKLILLVDGEKIELISPSGSTGDRETNFNRYTGAGVTELAAFPTTKEIIEKITAAKKVEIALYADKGRLERSFRKGNFKPFKEFMDKIVNGEKENPKPETE